MEPADRTRSGGRVAAKNLMFYVWVSLAEHRADAKACLRNELRGRNFLGVIVPHRERLNESALRTDEQAPVADRGNGADVAFDIGEGAHGVLANIEQL